MPIVFLICGLVSIAYGVRIMLIGSGTWFFAFWYVLGALALIAALAVHLGWWNALPNALRRATGIATCLLLAGFLVTQACIFSQFNDSGEESLDCIIVLGAQVHENGPSVVLKHRLDTAADYLERNPKTRCIVSGGRGPNEHVAEADVMFDYLVGRGISAARIVREDSSLNTKENIDYSAEFVDTEHGRIGMVTNNFHVFRSVGIARKAGYAHVCGIAAPSNLDVLPNNLMRESLSLAKDFLVGNL